ncbi:hypothetical protein [Conexibacter woesei]|uniref:hypothetical protein n=1 Tax=Conexibacter woesei TaxID=191495 RepID=UPI0004011687|nr:hypothetical protein [Conexibacter woesei]
MDSTSTLNPADEPTQTSVPFPDPTTSATAPVAAASACSNCGAALATDQRYCLVCGERNGDPRLPVMSGRASLSSPATPAVVTTTTRGPRGGGSTNTALIAGVGTLLVALGVGVVIGRSSDNNNSTAKTPQVITVGAPAAAAAGAAVAGAGASGTTPGDTSGAAASGSSDSRAKDSKNASSDGAKAKDSKSDAKAATPGNGRVAARKGTVVRLGQRGTGKGYKDGRFTGDFFGG